MLEKRWMKNTMIKVVIERDIMPGLEAEYDQIARAAMRVCYHAPGFIAGEILRERSHTERRMLITQWRDLAAWKAWEHSIEREQAIQQMLPMLTRDERVRVFDPF